VTDGTSNTIMLGEKAMDIAYYNVGGWHWDEPIFSSAGGTSRSNHNVGTAAPCNTGNRCVEVKLDRIENPPNYFSGFFVNNWGSSHSGAALFAMFDGSVRSIRHDADPFLVGQYLTIAGGEVPAPID
jgi:hypothetical protein